MVVGVIATLVIRAANDSFIGFEPVNDELIREDTDAFSGTFLEFAGNEPPPIASCNTGLQGNIFDVDFSKYVTANATRGQMEAAFGTQFSWWSSNNNGNLAIVDDYLRGTYRPSSKGSSRLSFNIDINGGNGVDEIWWEQQVYPEAGWEWGGSNQGGKLNGVQGGSSDAPWDGPPSGGYPPRAGEGFSLRNMWREGRNGGQEGRIVGYTYHIDQVGRFGDDLGKSDDIFIPIGEWSTIRHRVKMNSNDNQAKGQGDGVWEMWLNGEKVVSKNNLRFSANGNTHKIEQWTFISFYGGGDASWSPSKPTYMRFRCLKAGTIAPTAQSVNRRSVITAFE